MGAVCIVGRRLSCVDLLFTDGYTVCITTIVSRSLPRLRCEKGGLTRCSFITLIYCAVFVFTVNVISLYLI